MFEQSSLIQIEHSSRGLFLLPNACGERNTEQGERHRSTLLSEVRVLPDQFEPQLNLTRRCGR